MLVDLDMLLVAEFCQIQGPTVISSLPDFPCISGYTYRETERIISTLLLKVMSMNYPTESDQDPLPNMYNTDSYICVSYPLLSLIDHIEPDLYPDHHQAEQRTLHVLHLSTFLPDISARGYVRKISFLYILYDAKKLDHMRLNILFALNEALTLLKYAATISTKVDLARYVVGLNNSIHDLDRVQKIVTGVDLDKETLKERLLNEGFSEDFVTSVSFYALNNTITDMISSLKGFHRDAVSRFTLLRSETLPSIIIAVLDSQYASYFSRPYLQLFNQKEIAKLMFEHLILSTSTTIEDIDAVYSPYLTKTIINLLENSPNLVLCNSHDLYVNAKQPLRRLEEYLCPLFLVLFKEIMEKIYGFYRMSLVDILSTEQCQNSPVLLKFGEVFMFPVGDLEDSFVLSSSALHNNANILMDTIDDCDKSLSQFRSLDTPKRILYMPSRCTDTYNILLQSKWLFMHQYDLTTVSSSAISSLEWKNLTKEADLIQSLLDALRRQCIHTFVHYNHESKIGHLLCFLYALLSPRVFSNVCTSILQGKLLIVLCDKLIIAQILISTLSVFSAEVLFQPMHTRGNNPHIYKGRDSIDCLKLAVKLCQDLSSFTEYCLSISKRRGAKRATLVIFCNDTYIPLSRDALYHSKNQPTVDTSIPIDSGDTISRSDSLENIRTNTNTNPQALSLVSTQLDNDPRKHDLSIHDLTLSSANSTAKSIHIGRSLTNTATAGPSQSIFADASGYTEAENSENFSKDSVDFFEDLFEKLFIDRDHELCSALLATGDVKGLMILNTQIRYWPKEKINCSIVRSITVYFPGKGTRNATSKIGVSNDFISRRLQNGMSKFFSVFLSGRHQIQGTSHKHLNNVDCNNDLSESRCNDEHEAISPRSHMHNADASQRMQMRIKHGDARILPRFKAALMQVYGADPEHIEREWNSSHHVEHDVGLLSESLSMISSVGDFPSMQTLSANSGKKRAINDQTIYRFNIDVQSIMRDAGIDHIN